MSIFEDFFKYICNLGAEDAPKVEQIIDEKEQPFDWTPHKEKFILEQKEKCKEQTAQYLISLQKECDTFIEEFEIKKVDKFIFIKYNSFFQSFSLDDLTISINEGNPYRTIDEIFKIIKAADGEIEAFRDIFSSFSYYSVDQEFLYAPEFSQATKDKIIINGTIYAAPFGMGKVIGDKLINMIDTP